MTSRERVWRAIRHQPVDRCPVDLGGTRQTGISVWAYAHTSWKVMLHSDGALRPLLPSIIEMGVDILNPVQASAVGMDPARLKEEFGGRLVFWGGACDGQSTLARGTPEAVHAEARRNLAALAPGSGYVFASVHNIQADVPADNIVALFDAARP